MDKNSKKRDEIKEIEVVNPFRITPLLLIDPVTPQDYGGKQFDDFLGDEIGTEKITFKST